MEDSLERLFEQYPTFTVEENDLDQYGRMRALEQGLVSSVPIDQPNALQILGLYHRGEGLGAVSFFCLDNHLRKPKASRYGRVDLVITDPAVRGHGVGRLLVACALLRLFDLNPGCIYSVSCLAAHAAIATVLKKIGFEHRHMSERNYSHEEYRLGTPDEEREFRRRVWDQARECVQSVNYRLIQRRHAA